jgi:L-aminopeptidase/D-esterase-like protein
MPAEGRKRARDFGIPFGGARGPLNAITDVPGLEVGYTTLIEGDGPLRVGHGPVRTGVTAILPYGRDGAGGTAVAGWHSLNGNGEMTGTAWIEESGALSVPVLLTSTHSVGPCHQGTIQWFNGRRPDLAGQWLLPVVAETWDGYLNDANGGHVTPAHARAALDAASPGLPAEGAAGGGTGMTCYGFKGGSGTASRTVGYAGDSYTVGVFVQANFGARSELTVAGVPVGQLLGDDDPQREHRQAPPGTGSIIGVVATDAPLLPGQCKALARRVPLGLARTGTTGSHFSGDLFLAFSTAGNGALASTFPASSAGQEYHSIRFIPWGEINPLYAATVQAAEEAVINALVAGRSMTGQDGHWVPGLPSAQVAALVSQHREEASG